MRITNRDRSNLARFGCTFLAKQQVIYIPWSADLRDQVLSANIIVCPISTQHSSGPLLSLGFEISPTKILPHYCVVPFNLKNDRHRAYLASVCETGKIQFRFIVGSREISRTYQIPPHRLKRLSERYAAALSDVSKFPINQYDYEEALTEFEEKTRVVDYFTYILSESDLQQVVLTAKTQAHNVAPERRAQAEQLASEFLGIFRSRYDLYVHTEVDNFPRYARMLISLADFHNQFEGDYNAGLAFATNAIAAKGSDEENAKLGEAIQLLEMLLKILDHLKASLDSPQPQSPEQQAEFSALLERIFKQGFSFEALKELATVMGFGGGRPGRPEKDYSAEFKLKQEKRKWREIAEYRLLNDSDTRKEFGGRTLSELKPEEQRKLMHRVRIGVTTFGKRQSAATPGKLLPPEAGGQGNPA